MTLSSIRVRHALIAFVLGFVGVQGGNTAIAGDVRPTVGGRMGVLEEPLVSAAGASQREQGELREAIEQYRIRGVAAETKPLERFLAAHPRSAFRASLWLDIGLARLHAGMDTSADAALEKAKEASSYARDQEHIAVNQRAVAELLLMHARLGHPDRLVALLREVNRHDPRGIAAPAASIALMALQDMRSDPAATKLCGWIALNTLLDIDAGTAPPKQPTAADGYSLQELVALAESEGRHVVPVRRGTPSQSIPVPSLVHFRSGHFANILAQQGDRFLVRDPTQLADRWLDKSAIEEESSGNFLVTQELAVKPSSWFVLDRAAADHVRGAGFPTGPDPHGKPCENGEAICCPDSCSGPGGSSGMPRYGVNSMLIGLVLQDTPLSYRPPKGPAIDLTLTYNQKDADQPSTFTFGNFGSKWAFNWLEYIQDDPAHVGTSVMLYLPDGQGRLYSGYNVTTHTFAREPQSGANLVLTSTTPVTYTRQLPDGGKEVFSTSDGSSMYPRRIFLTQRVDRHGNAVNLAYDASDRLLTVTDALGQSSTLHYDVAGSPNLVSSIDDPFGRNTTLAYDTNGRLLSITDAIGMTSSFGYAADSTIQSLTTPYGTTQFVYSQSGSYQNGGYLRLDTTDVLGNVSRYEFRQGAPGIPGSDPDGVPSGLPGTPSQWNVYINGRNSFYWDAEIFAISPADYTKARIQHWEHVYNNAALTADVLESVKYPLERRIWNAYPDETAPRFAGTLNKPSHTARILADGTTQLTYNEYNSFGKVTPTIDPSGLETDITYGSNNVDPIQIDRCTTDPALSLPPRHCLAGAYHTTENFTYDSQHDVLTHTDEAGKTWEYTYDFAGQMISATDPLGDTTNYIYDDGGYLTTVIDANVHTTSYTYDAVGRLETETDPAGYTKTYTYDDLNRVTRITYWDQTYEENTYDKLDRVSHRDRLGHVTSYTYDGMRNLLDVTDPEGNVTSYTYYKNNLLKTKTDAAGGTTTWIRDIEGRVTEVLDPDNNPTSYAYDVANRKISETNALGQATNYLAYDLNGRLLRSQDANGVITDRTYHPRGWPAVVTVRANADGSPSAVDSTTTRTYDDVGKISLLVDPDGVATKFGYDDAHRLTSVADAPGNKIVYTLDPVGNRLSTTTYNPSQKVTRSESRTFDERNLVATTTDGLGHTSTNTHDGNRELSSTTDRLGVLTNYTHDVERRLTQIVQDVGGSDPGTANAQTTLGYDNANRLVSVTDPDSLVTSYTLDGVGRTTQLESPDSGQTNSTYDPAGNELTKTDNRNITATSTYDALNRLASTTYPDSTLNLTYVYDQNPIGCGGGYPVGRLSYVSDSTSTLSYCYDNRGNVVSKSEVINGTTLTTNYTYTLANRLASITFPSGATVTYQRDADGRVISVKRQVGANQTTLVSNVTYYPYGPVNVLTFGSGRTLTKNYNKNYAIGNIVSSASSGLNYNYGVDAESDITSIQPTGGATQYYQYDALRRLTTVGPGAGFLESYTYNKTGDRLSAALNNGTPTAYAYGAGTHHLASVGSVSRTYDANGDTLTGIKPSLTLGYDDRSRLAVAGSTIYKYDALGQRVQKQGLATTLFSYDEVGRLLGEYSTAGASQVEYIYLDEIPLAVAKSSGTAYLETDHLGTPRVAFDSATGSTLWTWDLLASAFGTNSPNQNGPAYTLNLRFPGQRYDAETGLNYNYQRDYEPTTGRYAESDPLGLAGSSNTYAYAIDNPSNMVDSTGLMVNGAWAPSPRFNITDFYITGFELVRPSWSWWGYLQFIRAYAHVDGYINIDVDCSDDCQKWSIHRRIPLSFSGSHDFGPNIYALVISRGRWVSGFGAQATFAGGALLQFELELISEHNVGELLSLLSKSGPTAICLGAVPE